MPKITKAQPMSIGYKTTACKHKQLSWRPQMQKNKNYSLILAAFSGPFFLEIHPQCPLI